MTPLFKGLVIKAFIGINLFTPALAQVTASSSAPAGVHCHEKITTLIYHDNGNVYFTTPAVCKNWCQIGAAGEDARNRAFSLMLAAKTSDKRVNIYWRGHPSCSTVIATYAKPEYIVLID